MLPAIYVCNISHIAVDERILSVLPADRSLRIRQALKPQKAVHLYVSAMLRDYILSQYGISAASVRVNSCGKPYVDGGLFFNLSHSGSYVLMAVSDRTVGIDIQEQTDISEKGARFFLNQEELAHMSSASNASFTSLWCRKEALIKCLGCGWNRKPEKLGPIYLDKLQWEGKTYCLADYPALEQYEIALCEENEIHREFTIKEVSGYDLERFYGKHQ